MVTVVHMIGNAHIDPVWLWGWQSGVDEAIATVSSAADRCDEYPEFIFTRGEAWVYDKIERLHPELFERVRRRVAEGRWFIPGGTYVQPDLNQPTEIGMRRQIQRGQAYFDSRFGVRPKIGYHVDSFGHPAYLPDLLTEHGYIGYVFRRPERHQMTIPFSSFRWRGAGGGELLAFRTIPGYEANYTDLYGQIMVGVDAADPALGHTMCFYGVGNHGGGPTKGQIEWIQEHKNAFDGIELRFSSPGIFFDAIAAKRDSLPLVEGEMQHTFPGCYSVMSDVKRAQRKGEFLLDQAERVVKTFGRDDPEHDAQLAKISSSWDDLLFTEFHDIVTGTSIPSAWASCRAFQGRARVAAEEVILDATRRWSYRSLEKLNEHRIVVLNTDDAPFNDIVECEPWLDFDVWHQRWLSDLKGNPLPFQQVQPEAMQLVPRIIFPAAIGAEQAAQFLVRSDPPPKDFLISTDLQASPDRLANKHIELLLGPGGIRGLNCGGKAVLGEGGVKLQLRKDTTDTWTFHDDQWREEVEIVLGEGEWIVEEAGPLRARVRLDGRVGTSRLRWTLSLLRDDPRVFMKLEINFDERFRLLQMLFNLAQTPRERVEGVMGGSVARGLSKVEWPVHGWSRLSLGHADVALVTNDAYSVNVDANRWEWTLMRSPRMAWGGGEPAIYAGREWFTDQGIHELDFELRVGPELSAGDLTRAARRRGQPVISFDRYEGMNRPSFGAVPPRGMWYAGMKRNLADGRIKDPGAEANVATGLWTREDD